jgi:type I restriction enzyme S subunit
LPYLRNIDVQWDAINFVDLPEMDIPESEYKRYVIKEGDLLVCEGGEVGRAAIVGSLSALFGFQKALHRLRALKTIEVPRFMYYTLYWAAKTGIFNSGGISTIAHLTSDQLRKFRFPAPSYDEQTIIANYLDRETAKIDRLVDKVEAATERLQEYRTALITAAVTGKIDVREVVA